MRCSSLSLMTVVVLGVHGGSTADCSEESCPSASSLLQRNQHRDRLAPGDSLHNDDDDDDVSKALSRIPVEVLSRMVLPEPYPCELEVRGDLRFEYKGSVNGTVSLCGYEDLSDGLHPLQLNTTARWRGSLRLLQPIGSLPCCPTPPYCRAPTCSLPNPYGAPPEAKLACTKAPAEALYSYLTHEDIWPAYFGQGGSADLDVLKHWDVLGRLFGCYDNSTGRCRNTEPFDLSIDLGADWGSYTERFMSRKFAKDSIMMDCIPRNKQAFDMRLGNAKYMNTWYSGGHIVDWPSSKPQPQFEFLSYALSNESGGTFDICDPAKTWGLTGPKGEPLPPCPVPIATVDSIVPLKLSPTFQSKFAQAQNLYIKMDLDGMDQMAIDGMRNLLGEVRGTHENGSPRYLVNFMMLEFCPSCLVETKQDKGFTKYDLGTHVQLLESLGFELFLIGPHYIPLSHGSWSEVYDTLFSTPQKCPPTVDFDKFSKASCDSPLCKLAQCMSAADLFAMRSSHPSSTEIKLALGSCVESPEFHADDAQYAVIP